jgi:error-prone DNA polymerase
VYIELHASSAFSFLDGASLPEAIVERAAELGYPAVALLDRDGVYGIPRFHLAAKRAGLKAIVGAELTVAAFSARDADGGSSGAHRKKSAGVHIPDAASRIFTLPVLVASREGYRNLCRLITRMKLRAPKGEGALTLDDLDGQIGGLVALVGRGAINAPRFGVGGLVERLVGVFGAEHVVVELQRHLLRDEESDNHALRDLASAFHVPIVATNGVRFAQPADRPLYDVLTCIRHKTTLDRAGRRLSWNAERYLKAPDAMARLFNDLPAAIAGTRELADRLAYTMADLGYRFPDYPVPAGETMASFLRKITQAGARERYRPYHDRARRQVERELDLIEKLELAGYFLIVWDIVNYCRQHDILVQGRGSAANSAVCYSLGITAVDPVGMDLLFERFLSEERGEWPDIDIDLPSGDRRERVIQHVYEKYGKSNAGADGPRAAMTANVITYRGRSAAREVGKTLSLEPAQIDRLAKVMNHFEWVDPKETLERNLREVGIDYHQPAVQVFGQLWQQIQDLPRHLGQHSGGMVLCHGRLDDIVPLENASMPNRVVVQWDKDDCADMGLIKVDLLGLGMMAVLQDALHLVNSRSGGAPAAAAEGESSRPEAPASANARGGPVVDLAHLPPDDPGVYKMLQEADTVGIFQVESRAQMATLPRLRPERFYDIVVEVAIIRPGPIVGQMVHPYLKRRQGAEPVVYPHPMLEPILARTLGVPLFQEQLLRMAMVAAGFSGGEAEELRRAFGFKRSEKRMQQIETKLRAGMTRQGITGDAAEEIIRSITSFALYGFPESHAASFALLVYASAYLKVHYPAAFFTAMLNNQPMGFYHPATLVKDAQRHGVRFAPIDVQESDWECRIELDGRVRLGLMYVNGLREPVGRAIAERRGAKSAVLSSVDSSPEFDQQRLRPGERAKRDEPRERGWGPASTDKCEQRLRPERGAKSASESAWGWPPPPTLRRAPPERSEGAGPTRIDKCERHCPKCGCDDQSMLEVTPSNTVFCNTCAHEWSDEPAIESTPHESNGDIRDRDPSDAKVADDGRRYVSIEDLIAQTGIRRDELATLAEIGALNAFGHHRRSALWQIERAIRPSGDLFAATDRDDGNDARGGGAEPVRTDRPREARDDPAQTPLRMMTPPERLLADYSGTSLTIGPHPMAMRRGELALRGVLRARDLAQGRHGRRVRIAGAVITRQRPGTAKGFVFLTLEDETGIANIIVRPDLFSEQRSAIVGEPYLLVEGTLQIQEGVTSIKAERVLPLATGGPNPESHDFR